MQKVRDQPFVTFVGVSGSGKSAMAHHIAIKLQGEGYEVVPIKDIKKIEEYSDPRNPQVFVIDDVVGVFGLQKSKLDALTDYEQKITKPCMVKSRTLMTCRETVLNETQSHKAFLCRENSIIRLHSSHHAFDDNDKKQILKKYGLDEDLVSQALASTSLMFPLLCKLFSSDTKFQADGSIFFMNPIQCIIKELDEMKTHKALNYAALVLCMLNANSLSKDILNDTVNKEFKNMKINTLENCKLESQTDAFKFVDALSAMEGTYTKQCGDQYTFIHDSMFEICAYHYGKQFPDQILNCMSSSYIANHVKPQSSEQDIVSKMKVKQSDSQCIEGNESSNDIDKKENRCGSRSSKGGESSDESDGIEESDEENKERGESFDLCIRLREDQYPLLAQRLYRDIQNMELYDVFRNQVLKHPQVCQAFIGELKTKSYTELKSTFLSSHGMVDKVVSKRRCVEKERGEYSDEWRKELWRQSVLVDQREEKWLYYTYNVRVISWVIYYGHHQIIQYILQQVQQHNDMSELFRVADDAQNSSILGIFEMIKFMISDISRRRQKLVEKCRLLLLSCYSGDVQTVRILLPVCKRTIDREHQICRGIFWYQESPLTAACRGGHVSVVEELVKAGADVNLKGNKKHTPLIAACGGGYVSVVEELVKAGVDVNLQIGLYTPLMSACEGGHVSVVEELVKAGADVNVQDDDGYTPLIAVCRGGHVSVVDELVKAGADVNRQDIFRNIPLIVAVSECSLLTVKCLVEHGADLVTQVVDIKVSAVYRSLILNKPDVVKYLIQEQNKISPGQYTGNVHLFNCLVDIRHAGVTTNSRDDVVVTDRSVWCMDVDINGMVRFRIGEADVWETISEGDCAVLRRLLCVGLDVNQSVQLCYGSRYRKSDVRSLLCTLIGEGCVVRDRTEKVRMLLEVGADVNVRVRDREDDSVLDKEGVSVLERTRRLVCQYSRFGGKRYKEYKCILYHIKKHVRRYSV
jgi:ankyrin repeat protein